MEPSDWIAIAGVAATAFIAVVSLFHASWRQQKQQHREDELRKAQQKREDELRERHREDTPHIEFGLDCRVHGCEQDEYLVEFILTAHNKGLVQQRFTSIMLRVRGIERTQPLTHWKGNEPRLAFPVKVIDDADIIPPGYNFIFVEPGVRQSITYVTKLSAAIKYIVAHVEFQYDRFTPHTAERAFRIAAREGPDGNE
jgi:hypothetical protein